MEVKCTAKDLFILGVYLSDICGFSEKRIRKLFGAMRNVGSVEPGVDIDAVCDMIFGKSCTTQAGQENQIDFSQYPEAERIYNEIKEQEKKDHA